MRVLLILGCLCVAGQARLHGTYVIDDTTSMGRRFDGIGAISGGGATSKLLVNYPQKQRDDILDYLFKPQFGASLQILKVEIGGDSQSTDGTESSHMHNSTDLNFNRGYEWWLMKEAKKRNPDILLYGLPWVWPGWLGDAQRRTPYANLTATVDYIVKWVEGARDVHQLNIDYIGIWNERPYNTDYIKLLRGSLDSRGLAHVKIVAADGEWQILEDLVTDPELQQAIDIIGVHYPGATSPAAAQTSNKPLWASEEYSAVAGNSGGGCWARILSESYVHGQFTGVIAWNLVSSYYAGLPYSGSSLMTARQPWSGHYSVDPPVWATAHFSQFTAPGWYYYPHSNGVGNLTGNGTYVTLASPDFTDFTIIIVAMDTDFAHCFYHMPKYEIAPQTAEFVLQGHAAGISMLHVWMTRILPDTEDSFWFQSVEAINVVNGRFVLEIEVNTIYTLTTIDGRRGYLGIPPPAKDFPHVYEEDFESYEVDAEPFNLVSQAGVLEVVQEGSNKFICQMVTRPPVDTCRPEPMPRPVALVGDISWEDASIELDFFIPDNATAGVMLASRVSRGGCWTMYTQGVFLWAYPGRDLLQLTANATKSFIYGSFNAAMQFSRWHNLRLDVKGDIALAYLDHRLIAAQPISSYFSSHGFSAIGLDSYGTAYFDNLKLKNLNAQDSTAVFKHFQKRKNRHRENSILEGYNVL